MKTIDTKRMLKYTFTPQELAEQSKALAYACQQQTAIEAEKKEVMSGFKLRLDTVGAEIGRFSNNVNNGYDYRDIDCQIRFHTPTVGLKCTVRMDTGEMVEELKMSPEEMQENLFDVKTGEDKPKKKRKK